MKTPTVLDEIVHRLVKKLALKQILFSKSYPRIFIREADPEHGTPPKYFQQIKVPFYGIGCFYPLGKIFALLH